ncbi:hypothetical protein T484DRAFT_1980197 [Baffinella frigidus]|nr:hypothetical protein T484DRAFT_1980197 [Cryptophyta sp. CCMP2293]
MWPLWVRPLWMCPLWRWWPLWMWPLLKWSPLGEPRSGEEKWRGLVWWPLWSWPLKKWPLWWRGEAGEGEWGLRIGLALRDARPLRKQNQGFSGNKTKVLTSPCSGP